MSKTESSSAGGGVTRAFIWKAMPPVDYFDATLTINDWETVVADLSGGLPAQLWRLIVEQTNNGATVETLELEITINGTAYTITMTGIASGVRQYVYTSRNLVASDFSFLAGAGVIIMGGDGLSAHTAHPFVAETVGLIRVRQTTTVDGTLAQIEVNVTWNKLVAV